MYNNIGDYLASCVNAEMAMNGEKRKPLPASPANLIPKKVTFTHCRVILTQVMAGTRQRT